MNTGTHALKVNKGVKEFPGERDKFTVTGGIYLGQNLQQGNGVQLWPYRTLPGVPHLQPQGHLPGNTDSLTPKEIIAHNDWNHPDTNMQKTKSPWDVSSRSEKTKNKSLLCRHSGPVIL